MQTLAWSFRPLAFMARNRERIVAAATNAGGRLIAVDALDDAAHRFYCHHDFQPIQGSRRLVMKIATARAALDRFLETGEAP